MRLVISGTVGIGKSTTAELLVKKLEEKGKKVNYLKEETVDSPYLAHYYDEPETWAFVAQLDFLFGRFKQWLVDEKERSESNEDIITIYDRHILDDYIFAELHSIKESISNLNSVVYQAIYKELLEKITDADAKPDYFFLLEADLSTIVKRLNNRGREEEMETTEDYWRDLYESYYIKPKFIHHFAKNTKEVVRIETTNLTPEEVVDSIIEKLNL